MTSLNNFAYLWRYNNLNYQYYKKSGSKQKGVPE